MNNELIRFIIFFFSVIIYTIIWGKTIDTLVKSKYVLRIAKFLMNYSRLKLDQIRFVIIWLGYLFVSMIGTIIFSIIFKINIFD